MYSLLTDTYTQPLTIGVGSVNKSFFGHMEQVLWRLSVNDDVTGFTIRAIFVIRFINRVGWTICGHVQQ